MRKVTNFWRPANNEDPTASGAGNTWHSFGFTTSYGLNRGYVTQITDSAERSWWSNPTYDYLDRVVGVMKGNALWTQRAYRPEDGLLESIKTGITLGAHQAQNLTYGWDGLGNLKNRSDGAMSETFGYDDLNRLEKRDSGHIAGYADNGNILWKLDVAGVDSRLGGNGDYQYDSSQPHAVTSAWGYSMTYDFNGNLVTREKPSSGERWRVQMAGFDKPRWMAKATGATVVGSEFLYNAARQRIAHLEFNAMSGTAPDEVPSHYVRKKLYVGGAMELDYRNRSDSGTDWKFERIRLYVPAPDGTVGAVEMAALTVHAADHKAQVYHYDHLGSIESITNWGDLSGNLALDECDQPSRYSYDPWGERRDPIDWVGKPQTTTHGGQCDLTPRGFTGHEMLDDLGLVHMNGRIYDPLIGRMLSADVLVQHPGQLQSYNRYSYVRNNPLTLVDPSGFLDETAFANQLHADGAAGAAFLGEMETLSASGYTYNSFTSYVGANAPNGGNVGGVYDRPDSTVYVQDGGDMQNTVDHTVHETGHIPQTAATNVGQYRANEHGAFGKETQYQIDAGRPGDLAKGYKTKDPATGKNVTRHRIDSAAIDARLDDKYKLKGVNLKATVPPSDPQPSDFKGVENISVNMVRLAYDARVASVASRQAGKAASQAEKAATRAEKAAEKMEKSKTASNADKVQAREAAQQARAESNLAKSDASAAAAEAARAKQAADAERQRLKSTRGY